MLIFYPDLLINYNWVPLIAKVEKVAETLVHSGDYKNNLLYKHGASEVANMPEGGWISKQDVSYDFFVMGGIDETVELENKFKKLFPTLTFTPATIAYSTSEIPMHRDAIKNGQTSLVYPLHNHDSISKIYDNDIVVEYKFKQDIPIILNITKQHEVINTGKRICFCIHFHESIKEVKQQFDKLGKIIL